MTTVHSCETIFITGEADWSDVTILYAGRGIAVQVGDGTTILNHATVRLPHVICASKPNRGWAPGTEGVRVVNTQSCTISVPHVQGFTTGLSIYGQGQGSVHDTYLLGHLDNNKRNLVLDADETGWSNSNLFLGGRYSHNSEEGVGISGARHILLSSATNVPNGNTWVGPSVEGAQAEFMIDVDAGAYNTILNPRLESAGAGRVRWGPAAVANAILGGYQASWANVATADGASRNTIQATDRFDLFGSTADGILRLRNEYSSAAPAMRVYEPGQHDPARYVWSLSADALSGKRSDEARARVELDRVHGYVRAGTAVQTGANVTHARPSSGAAGSGAMWFDTTLGKPIWSTGAAWVDATGATV